MEEKIKRRQPLSLTRNLTNNHSITVLSPFWQSTSSFVFTLLPSEEDSHPALVISFEQETYRLVMLRFFEWNWGRHPPISAATTGTYLPLIFIPMSSIQQEDWNEFHVLLILEISAWPPLTLTFSMLALLEILCLLQTQHLAFLVARWGC